MYSDRCPALLCTHQRECDLDSRVSPDIPAVLYVGVRQKGAASHSVVLSAMESVDEALQWRDIVFTIALLIAGVICFWRGKFVLNTYQLILTALLVGLTMMAKVIHFNSIAANYLCFLAMLVLFPCVIKENQDAVDFWELTIFFACGIITAALSAQQVAGYPNISQYITVDSYSRITRLSGYYGDPNFYSAHITACLAGVQLLLSQERKRRRQIVLIVFSVLLIYCGLLSASKSFVMVTACLFLVWIPILLEKGNCGGKFGILMGLLCAGLIVRCSRTFFRSSTTGFPTPQVCPILPQGARSCGAGI